MSPDLDRPDLFIRAWDVIQKLIQEKMLTAGHDRSDGGLITTLLEMCFAGNCGMRVTLPAALVSGAGNTLEQALFAEELGICVEVSQSDSAAAIEAFKVAEVPCHELGYSTVEQEIFIEGYLGSRSGEGSVSMVALRNLWESTSFALELQQCNPDCVEQERKSIQSRLAPPFRLTFEVVSTERRLLEMGSQDKPCVAILRDEGSNGDREMASAFFAAGFEVWDVHVRDLLSGAVRLDAMKKDGSGYLFRGVVFVGGFSYADTLDSAKGWAGTILFNDNLWAQFKHFYNREDTFSLGVCNGCQLMALLGWIPEGRFLKQEEHGSGDGQRTSSVQPRFVHNTSGRFESRFSSVKVATGTPAGKVWFKDM